MGFSTYLALSQNCLASSSLMCFAKSLPTIDSLFWNGRRALWRDVSAWIEILTSELTDLTRSAARSPAAATTRVCGEPFSSDALARSSSFPLNVFKNSGRLSNFLDSNDVVSRKACSAGINQHILPEWCSGDCRVGNGGEREYRIDFHSPGTCRSFNSTGVISLLNFLVLCAK